MSTPLSRRRHNNETRLGKIIPGHFFFSVAMNRLRSAHLTLRRWVTVEPALFLYMLGIFLLFGVFQSMLYDRVCLSLYQQDECGLALYQEGSEDRLTKVQESTSHWVRIGNSIHSDCSFLLPWVSREYSRTISLYLRHSTRSWQILLEVVWENRPIHLPFALSSNYFFNGNGQNTDDDTGRELKK